MFHKGKILRCFLVRPFSLSIISKRLETLYIGRMTKAGRPTKYSAEALKKAQNYIQKCRKCNRMPFIEELALELGVNDDTLVEWGEKHSEFSATLGHLKLLQRLALKRGALERKLQPNIAIFLLKVNHGLNEKEPEQQGTKSLVVSFVSPDFGRQVAIGATKKGKVIFPDQS